ncbi:hypothetical protein LOK49_LG01G02520 [Camellia lanceoleosa]|uniref:Uncharacterized protein n=1 Tax=Camellia lanceoleosa TaxID=1840588 RepID=A0ACC0IUE2_9ERIC|nr:hypothetical protein LOK49_LG01G02520 [Camellia lanceoleosa]
MDTLTTSHSLPPLTKLTKQGLLAMLSQQPKRSTHPTPTPAEVGQALVNIFSSASNNTLPAPTSSVITPPPLPNLLPLPSLPPHTPNSHVFPLSPCSALPSTTTLPSLSSPLNEASPKGYKKRIRNPKGNFASIPSTSSVGKRKSSSLSLTDSGVEVVPEKRSGLARPHWSLFPFRSFVDGCGLLDLGYHGFPFTWRNNRHTEGYIVERLDRVLASADWRVSFDRATVTHCECVGSDHNSLLLDLYPHTVRPRSWFKFDSWWIGERDCKTTIQRSWEAIIPGSRMFQRKVLTDPWCPRCGVELETLDHLLLRCPDSQLVWKCSPLRLEWPSHITLDCFSECLGMLGSSLKIRQMPPSISSLAIAEWIEFSVALDLPPRDQASSLPSVPTAALSHVSPPINRWMCPPCGYIKLNVDASTRDRAFRAGIGIVGRTSVGAILFIKSIPLFTCPSPRVLEALAVREALQQVLFGQHRNIIVEGDAKVVYQSLNGAMQPPQDIAVIVQDCRTLSLSFNSVCFSFVPRLCNGVAHDIAHHALSIDEARVWDVCFPSWCLHSHQSDIGSLDPL